MSHANSKKSSAQSEHPQRGDRPAGSSAWPRRRKIVVGTAASGAAALIGHTLPGSWSRPVVESVILPAHAQTSVEAPSCSCQITSLDVECDQYILDFTVSDCEGIDRLVLSWTGPSAPGGVAFPSTDPTDSGSIANAATFSPGEEYTATLEVQDADSNVLSSCTATATAPEVCED